jgi:hypothetical protein
MNLTHTEIILTAIIIGLLSGALITLLFTIAIRQLAEQPPADELTHMIRENTKQYNYWKTLGNDEYANAYMMLINAFTQPPTDETKP